MKPEAAQTLAHDLSMLCSVLGCKDARGSFQAIIPAAAPKGFWGTTPKGAELTDWLLAGIHDLVEEYAEKLRNAKH